MKMLKWFKRLYINWLISRSKQKLISEALVASIDPDQFSDSLKDPNAYYRRLFQDFHRAIPEALRAHRAYYSIDHRGFGEDAFHTMWWRLIRQFKPESFL